jgi:hypothetical protein
MDLTRESPEDRILTKRFERILLVVYLLTIPLANPWVRGDGVGYYAYARAPLIEHNLDFTHDYQFANQSFRDARCDPNLQPKAEYRTRTSHLDNHFSVGPAMLWSPFLLLVHGGVLLARQFGSLVPADGFSAPYRYAMAVGTCIYGFLGLWLSFRLACRYVKPRWAFIATLAVWGASSLPVYMYFNPSWSHAHSAFIVAAYFLYWDTTRQHRSFAQWLILGLIVGIMLDVYYLNAMALTVLIVEAIRQYLDAFRSPHPHSENLFALATKHAAFSVMVIVTMIPTFVSRWVVYGGPLESGYVSIRDYLWSSPVFFSVLFSSNHGLLAWTPILVFAIVGLLLLAFRLPEIGVPFLSALVAFYIFLSFYPDWAGIASFGNRFFISLTSLWVFGLAYLFDQLSTHFKRIKTPTIAFSTLAACFVFWNVGLMYQWGTHLVPARGPVSFRAASYNQIHVVPFQIGSRLWTYFSRRGQLMEQIEQKDVDQQREKPQP